MKNIKKIGKTVATSALLVGATLAGAAGVAAQSGSSGDHTLGDYPQPFVAEDGTVQSTVVVGESARTVDVVGGINVAGSLSQAAFTEEQKSAGGASFGWSATNGVSLDTRNDQLYFGQTVDEIRQTLTEDQLDVLQTQEAFTGDEEQEVEQYLYVGNQEVLFGTPGDTSGEEDPFLYVNNPANPNSVSDETQYLYKLQANFEDGVEFVDDNENDDRNDDVYGEEVSLFGMSFTVADDSFTSGNQDQLVLYGSQQTESVSTGESSTLSVGGQEVEISVVGVTGPDTSAIEIDGDLEEYSAGDEIDVNGQTLRVDNIIQTNSDNSQGTVKFAIGSQKVILEDNSEVMVGEDEEDVDGTHVSLSVSGDGNIDSSPANGEELSSIEIAVGAPDSDESFVRAGESFQGPVFEDVAFQFGGLNPDAGEGASDSVGEIEFATDGDDVATVSFSEGDNSVTQEFAYDNGGDGNPVLQDSDADNLVVEEGAAATEDDYIATDAGDFSHMWEVTNVDADADADSELEEATVELEDVVTGATVEVEGTETSSDSHVYTTEEVIDGQSYHFQIDGSNDEVKVTWGTNAGASEGSVSVGDRKTLFAAQDTESGAAVALTEELTGDTTLGPAVGESDHVTYELPSTESTDTKTLTLWVDQNSGGTDGTLASSDVYKYQVNGGSNQTIQDGSTGVPTELEVAVGQSSYVIETSAANNDDWKIDQIGLDPDQESTGETTAYQDAAAVVFQPEDDGDNEHAYVVKPENDDSDNYIEVHSSGAGDIEYTGTTATDGSTSSGYNAQPLESDDDVQVSYSMFGTHTMEDTDEQGTFTIHIPEGQSTAGAAVTGEDGSLSTSGGAGTVTTQMPAGWPDAAALDSDITQSDRSSQNLVLVGGPAVNGLVQDLVEANKTMAGSDYTQGQGMIQQIDDAFAEGYDALVVAGYSGEDTRTAANYIANYADHQDALAGQDEVSINTAQGSVVQ